MSLREQYLYHCRKFMSDFHLSFAEIENMPLEILLDIELVDSKVTAAFDNQRGNRRRDKKFIDQIL